MKKIAFHINCLEKGGAERVVINLAEKFASDGYDVSIVTEWIGKDEYPLSNTVKRVNAGLTEQDESKNRILKVWLRNYRLRQYLKKEKPDVVIAFAKKAIYRALMAAIGTKIPVILSVRINPKKNYEEPGDRMIINTLFPKAAGAVFQTDEVKEFFPAKLQSKSKVILNPISDKFIGVPRPESRTKTVVHVNRFVAFKNQILLVKAFDNVCKKYPEYVLKMYGADTEDGTLEAIQNYIKENSLENHVLIMGNSDSTEKEIVDAAFFVLPSDEEGLPNVLMEAMALGLPVISTDCEGGGARVLIEDKVNGLLVPIKNQEALEQAMIYMIENPLEAERMGAKAREICTYADRDSIYIQWKKYIEQII